MLMSVACRVFFHHMEKNIFWEKKNIVEYNIVFIMLCCIQFSMSSLYIYITNYLLYNKLYNNYITNN